MKFVHHKININNISTILFGILLFSTYVGNIVPFGVKLFSLSYLSVFLILSFLLIIFDKLKIKKNIVTELLFAIVLILPLDSNIINGCEMGEYFPIHFKMACYFIGCYFLLKTLLPFIKIITIEKIIMLTGYWGCFLSLLFYYLNFGNISPTSDFGCTRGVRLTGAIGDDPNIAMYSLVLFNALCMSKKGNLYLFGWVLSSVVIMLSMSRGAILAMLIAFCLSFFLKSQKKLRLLQAKMIFPILLVFIIFLNSINPIVSRLITRFSYDKFSGGAGRTQIWANAFNTFVENKYIGIGFGNTVNYNKKYYNSHFINHCTFLDYLVEGGPLNAFIFIILHIWLFYKMLINKRIVLEYPFILISFIMFSIISLFLSGGLLRAPFAIFLSLTERYTTRQKIDLFLCERMNEQN